MHIDCSNIERVNISIGLNLNIPGSLAVIIEADGNLHVKLQFQFLYCDRNSAPSLVGEIKHCGTKNRIRRVCVRCKISRQSAPPIYRVSCCAHVLLYIHTLSEYKFNSQ